MLFIQPLENSKIFLNEKIVGVLIALLKKNHVKNRVK